MGFKTHSQQAQNISGYAAALRSPPERGCVRRTSRGTAETFHKGTREEQKASATLAGFFREVSANQFFIVADVQALVREGGMAPDYLAAAAC